MFWIIIFWVFCGLCGFVIGKGCAEISESCSQVNDPCLSEIVQEEAKNNIYKWLMTIFAAIIILIAVEVGVVGNSFDKEMKAMEERVMVLEKQTQKTNI